MGKSYFLFFLLLSFVICWSSDIVFASDNILFVSDRDEPANWDLYKMNIDGSSIERLTVSSSIENHPDLSPDGSKVVFSSNLTGNFELYTAPLSSLEDESTWIQLTDRGCTSTICIPSRHPHWSPDGTKIIYTTKDGCRIPGKIVSQCSVPVEPDCRVGEEPGIPFERAHIINSDGTNDAVLDFQSLDSRIFHAGHPSFSPDGKKIVFTGAINKDATDWEVFTADWDVSSGISNLKQRTKGSKYPPNKNPIKMTGGAHFSLDGKLIYFSSTRTTRGNSQLFYIPADSPPIVKISDANRLTWVCGNDYVPEPVSDNKIIFTSDGSNIVNASGEPEWDLDICSLNTDGSERTNLTKNDFPSETLLIADEVSWFCGLPPNLKECKFTLRAVSIKSKALMAYSQERLPKGFPNKSKYPAYMDTTGNWLAEKYPSYLQRIQSILSSYINNPKATVEQAYYQIVIPSMMPETKTSKCSDCIEIQTDTLPDGQLSKPYTAQLKADEKIPSWKIIAGALPDGLNLKKKGSISGTPSKRGTFTFTVAAIRKDGNAGSKELSIAIQ